MARLRREWGYQERHCGADPWGQTHWTSEATARGVVERRTSDPWVGASPQTLRLVSRVVGDVEVARRG